MLKGVGTPAPRAGLRAPLIARVHQASPVPWPHACTRLAAAGRGAPWLDPGRAHVAICRSSSAEPLQASAPHGDTAAGQVAGVGGIPG